MDGANGVAALGDEGKRNAGTLLTLRHGLQLLEVIALSNGNAARLCSVPLGRRTTSPGSSLIGGRSGSPSHATPIVTAWNAAPGIPAR